jgi:hypothetical protein
VLSRTGDGESRTESPLNEHDETVIARTVLRLLRGYHFLKARATPF